MLELVIYLTFIDSEFIFVVCITSACTHEAKISTVPGPLIGGCLFEFAGLATPFFVSAAMLRIAFELGFRVFHPCAWNRDSSLFTLNSSNTSFSSIP